MNMDSVSSSPGDESIFNKLRKLSPCDIGEIREPTNPSQSRVMSV